MMGMTRLVALAALVLAVSVQRATADDRDPWEPVNRPVFRFNDALDRWVLEPVAKGYNVITPDELQNCISRFFWNLRAPVSSVNNLLQGKPVGAATEVGRFGINVVLGLAGFLDPAKWLFKLDRHHEDFGQTLGVWGLGNGPYVMLPLLGPSTVRDTGGLAVDSLLTPGWYFLPASVTIGSRVFDTVNSRSLVLEDVEHAREAAVDYYSFVRDAYLQHRAAELTDHGATEGVDESIYYPEVTPER